MQLLEADYSKRTSGSGFKPIITVKEFDDYLSRAKELFKKEFYKKTGNLWSLRHQFEKKHGKYDLVQLANLNETIPVLQMDTQSSLPATLQKLLILLFDINIINKTIADIDVDSRKMPLGVLADEQIKAGYETLLHLFHIVKKGKVSYNRIKDLSNKFYTKIPHKGTEKNLVVLDSVELIKSKVDMLNDLRNTHLSFRLLREEMDKSVNSMETFYNRLNTKIVALDKNSQEFNMILEYFTNTQSKTHLNNFKMHIDEIFLVEREGERERYEPYKSLHNRKLLWHGSRLSNISAILYEGLRIAPPEVIATGHMFGKGIYFADVATKSAQYIHATTDHPTGVLLLCEVALGNMKKCYSNEYVTELPDEYQSVCGVGRNKPDPSHTVTLQDGTIVPLGNIVPNDDMLSTQSQLIHNEYPF
ncbi:poly [ADP-ribose] polymerase-like isoform X2 [Zerene cesonia]|uniref:poly [ADP-ribose] polymerase-like isoform X2 n=1 Tax=Zerene cesonia TaxID=33412 RepID=UPI0018E56BCB|nr:poly [ADP-ribose] polymerase-like isoform X2 [Zerene cesonia]